MKTLKCFAALMSLVSLLSIVSCTKKTDPINKPVVNTFPTMPEGSRFAINFGTSTYNGCMSTFRNCIWIGWDATATNLSDRYAVTFDKPDEVAQYFGSYFPLTADFTVDESNAKTLGLKPQVIAAGFYPIQSTPVGNAVIFAPEIQHHVYPLVNPNNPQDNIGQIHNLAMQVILSPENRAAISKMNGDKTAIRQFILDKTTQFLTEAGFTLSASELQKVQQVGFDRKFSDYGARLDETRLSQHDNKVLRGILDEVSALPVKTTDDLSRFVEVMTNYENSIGRSQQVDDPTMVLSALSVLKYSRYYWFWHSISKGDGTATPSSIPEWVYADAIGLELGGPVLAIAASVVVYLDTH
jgi:hypothetical protein